MSGITATEACNGNCHDRGGYDDNDESCTTRSHRISSDNNNNNENNNNNNSNNNSNNNKVRKRCDKLATSNEARAEGSGDIAAGDCPSIHILLPQA